jgi:LmbE family N-acetylglucosaminyl deacetylase
VDVLSDKLLAGHPADREAPTQGDDQREAPSGGERARHASVMLEFRLALRPDRAPRALLLGAHCDDIELGCGGTILELSRRHPDLTVHWIVLSSTPERAREAERSADRFLAALRSKEVVIERFRDGHFPYEGSRVKEYVETLKARLDPDLVFTHYRDDWHQDHRLVGEITWQTFRDHLILEYEIPKYDPDGGSPNVFVHLDEVIAEAKVSHLLEAYASQASRPWFTRDTMLALMRLRGVQARAARYAEGFHARKVVLGGA